MSKSNSKTKQAQKKGKTQKGLPAPRVIRLSFTNIMIAAGILLLGLLLFNNASQPSLGDQVDIDTFLNNIEEQRYSRVDIRNDGNAVAYGKYVDVATIGEDQQLPGSVSDGDQPLLQEYEEKTLEDLINELTPDESLAGSFEALQERLQGKSIREIYVLEDRVLVDWDGRNDWVIASLGESEFVSGLNDENLDVAALGVDVTYLRSSGNRAEFSALKQRIESDKYLAVWRFEDQVFARVKPEQNIQNYVNFGTATADFTQFLQEEGVNLGSKTVEFSVLPISTVNLELIVNIILIGSLIFVAFILVRSMSGAGSGLMRFGQSKARMFFGQKTGVTFDDVAGVDEAKEQLKEVVDFLKQPEKYR
ncbi:MAG: hypothetical protein ACOCXP_04510, partial [Candidatus Dojkabacteria bacterium]